MFAVTNLVNKVITVGGDGTSTNVIATSGAGNTIVGPMSITNDVIMSANGAAVSFTLSKVLTGPGKISKMGAGTLIIAGSSSNYGGGLQLNAGNLIVRGTMSNAVG